MIDFPYIIDLIGNSVSPHLSGWEVLVLCSVFGYFFVNCLNLFIVGIENSALLLIIHRNISFVASMITSFFSLFV